MSLLILVPTQLELGKLIDDPKWCTESKVLTSKHDGQIWAVCGIGGAATALTTGQLITRHLPERVLMLGIAGAYRESGLQPGDVVQADRELFADLGYRDYQGFHTFDEMKLPVLPGTHGQWGCRYALSLLDPTGPKGGFVTLNAVTTDHHSASQLHRQFDAVAENMEGAAAAMACAWFDVPFFQVRGISNLVGPRDPKSWQIKESLANLRDWITPHLS